MDDILFIMQARSGSTRMPAKILQPFYGHQTVLDIIIEKLKQVDGTSVMVATTTNPNDQAIVDVAKEHGVLWLQGDENDVLQRFIDAAHQAGAKRIVRVCSDNPFLDLASMRQLVSTAQGSNADYISFDINGTPSIKTHYGFWTEYVTLNALERVKSLTDEKLYHEHVTNYIYAHPQTFDVRWIDGPSQLLLNQPIRLTIDTPEDFANAQRVYADTLACNPDLTIPDIVQYLKDNPQYVASMRQQIEQNSK